MNALKEVSIPKPLLIMGTILASIGLLAILYLIYVLIFNDIRSPVMKSLSLLVFIIFIISWIYFIIKTMNKLIRPRVTYAILMILLVTITWVLADPDIELFANLKYGSTIIPLLLATTIAFLFTGIAHTLRKSLMDYVNLEELYNRAKTTATGAGLFALAVSIVFLSISFIIVAAIVTM